ncbi:MAG: Mur ligase domain-containing protein, partial [Planctomycetota bacterium]
MRIAAGVRQSHLIGIGGYGMSALARLLHGLGARVSGSDLCESRRVHELRELGVDVRIGHSAENLRLDRGQIIYSAAVPDDCPELISARQRGLPCFLYSEAVGRLSEEVRTLAIAGTHGKTSTTALTVAALRAAGMDPSFLIGGEVPCLAGNGYGGGSELLVVEACEFNRSFHELRPAHAAILNVERDHFDCYPSREALEESFALYANKLRPGGSLLLHETVPDSVVDCLPQNIAVIRIGSGLFADLRALDVAESFGRFAFTPSWDGGRLPRVDLKLLGAFQVWNALFALGLAIQAGAEPERACHGLVSFDGVERRFQ